MGLAVSALRKKWVNQWNVQSHNRYCVIGLMERNDHMLDKGVVE